MGVLTDDMKRVVQNQRLAFVATVCPDNTPNLSPKGTIAVWGDDHLVFANIRSPRTISNLRHNPAIEINVVDPIVRKGYRFKGTATVVDAGARYEEITAFFRARGASNPIREVVVVTVEHALDQIAGAREQIRQVRVLLGRLGNRDEDLPIKERCAETLAAEGGTTSEVIKDRAALEAAMVTLESTIWNTFLGSGQRREDSATGPVRWDPSVR